MRPIPMLSDTRKPAPITCDIRACLMIEGRAAIIGSDRLTPARPASRPGRLPDAAAFHALKTLPPPAVPFSAFRFVTYLKQRRRRRLIFNIPPSAAIA